MKRCEICGRELTGKQQRFCSTLCRNRYAGAVSSSRYERPPESELAHLYKLPPEGEGLTLQALATHYGVSKPTVRHWLADYNLTTDPVKRISFLASRPNPKRRKQCPDVELLEEMYRLPPHGQGKTRDQIAQSFNVSPQVVIRWLKEIGVWQPHEKRHSKRMSGEGNPAYIGGNSQRYVHAMLKRHLEKRCIWCGTTEKVQVHHIDHDRSNNDLNNLTWLCNHCNVIEAQLWHLVNKGRVEMVIEGNELRVIFRSKT